MFVVAGVTGHTGRAAAERLLELAKPVRVIVRRAEQGDEWRDEQQVVAGQQRDLQPGRRTCGQNRRDCPEVHERRWKLDRHDPGAQAERGCSSVDAARSRLIVCFARAP